MTQYLCVVFSDVMDHFSNADSRQDKVLGCNGGHHLGSPDIRTEGVSQREAVLGQSLVQFSTSRGCERSIL